MVTHPTFLSPLQIRALNCEGPSEWSDLSPPLCTIMTPPEAPPAPRILAFTATPVSVEVSSHCYGQTLSP